MTTRKCQSCSGPAAPGRARCEACLTKDRERYRSRYRWSRQERHLLKEYRLTFAERRAMERKQRGRCAACGMKCEDLHVDHEHGTGIVRGLLCRGCNTAAGLLDDCHVRARGLAEYLAHHFEKSISPTYASMAAGL